MNRIAKILLWVGVSALGVLAVLISALQRGEPVHAMWLVIAGGCAFAISYRFYSLWLVTKVLVFDADRATPALTKSDGKDFVPTNKWVVFGHHFAAIAGPGPLVGPVLAAILLATGQFQPLSGVSRRTYVFLALSGLATGASWLCYYRALKIGPASGVALASAGGVAGTSAAGAPASARSRARRAPGRGSAGPARS